MLVEYKCDVGFSLTGSSTRVCKSDGMWSGEEPLCEGKQCYRWYVRSVYMYAACTVLQ